MALEAMAFENTEVARLRGLHGSDGRRVFVFPTVLSSNDAAFDGLDLVPGTEAMRYGGALRFDPPRAYQFTLEASATAPAANASGVLTFTVTNDDPNTANGEYTETVATIGDVTARTSNRFA